MSNNPRRNTGPLHSTSGWTNGPGRPSTSGRTTARGRSSQAGPSGSNAHRTSSGSRLNQTPKKESFNLSKFEEECLDEHNRLRALHGCPPLTLNRDLCKYATQWAENLAYQNTVEHRPNPKYGENIFKSTGYSVSGIFPVKKWYNEIEVYDFQKPAFRPEIGHFTQLIWKGSKQLGVGIARKADSVWVVTNYNPPGNVLNEFVENVPKTIS